MKWRQRVKVITGMSCTGIALNLTALALLAAGWFSGHLVTVSFGLCVFYVLAFMAMLVLQRLHSRRLREAADFLEELTTSWYFGACLLALWLLAQVLHHRVLLLALGLCMLAGPAMVSLFIKDKARFTARKFAASKQQKDGDPVSGDFPPEQNKRR